MGNKQSCRQDAHLRQGHYFICVASDVSQQGFRQFQTTGKIGQTDTYGYSTDYACDDRNRRRYVVAGHIQTEIMRDEQRCHQSCNHHNQPACKGLAADETADSMSEISCEKHYSGSERHRRECPRQNDVELAQERTGETGRTPARTTGLSHPSLPAIPLTRIPRKTCLGRAEEE